MFNPPFSYANATLDVDFSKALAEGVTNRYASMLHEGKPLIIDLTVSAADYPVDSMYGRYVWAEPTSGDMPKLVALDNYFKDPVNIKYFFGQQELPYIYKNLLTEKSNFRLKLKGSLADLTIAKGDLIKIRAQPGFYFNEADGVCGGFLSIKPKAQ